MICKHNTNFCDQQIFLFVCLFLKKAIDFLHFFTRFVLFQGYHEVVRIPPNSRHLHISEVRESPPYLSLKDASGHSRLNGQWVIDWPGRYEAAGTVFSYRRWPGKSESLVVKGPTTEELIVEVLLRMIMISN